MSARPVFPFIVGCQRSGTTLLRSMLAAGPDLAIPPESGFILRLHRQARRPQGHRQFDNARFVSDVLGHRRVRNWGLRGEELQQALAAFPAANFPDAVRRLYEVYAAQLNKLRYGEKTPDYVRFMPVLARLFPEARFIHMVRDGRDVALSLVGTGLEPGPVGDAAVRWKREVETGRRDGNALGPGRYKEIRYEELIDRPSEVLRAVCDFFEVRFDESMLSYFERPIASRWLTAMEERLHPNLSLPPTKGLRDWRRELSVSELDLIEALIGDSLERFGYERSILHRSVRSHLRVLTYRAEASMRLAHRRFGNLHIKIRRWSASRESITAVAQSHVSTAKESQPH